MPLLALPAGHPTISTGLLALGRITLTLGDARSAELHLREALQIRRKTLPPGHTQTTTVVNVLSDCLIALERFREAEELLTENYKTVNDRRGQEHQDTQDVIKRLVSFHAARRNDAEAARYRSLLASR